MRSALVTTETKCASWRHHAASKREGRALVATPPPRRRLLLVWLNFALALRIAEKSERDESAVRTPSPPPPHQRAPSRLHALSNACERREHPANKRCARERKRARVPTRLQRVPHTMDSLHCYVSPRSGPPDGLHVYVSPRSALVSAIPPMVNSAKQVALSPRDTSAANRWRDVNDELLNAVRSVGNAIGGVAPSQLHHAPPPTQNHASASYAPPPPPAFSSSQHQQQRQQSTTPQVRQTKYPLIFILLSKTLIVEENSRSQNFYKSRIAKQSLKNRFDAPTIFIDARKRPILVDAQFARVVQRSRARRADCAQSNDHPRRHTGAAAAAAARRNLAAATTTAAARSGRGGGDARILGTLPAARRLRHPHRGAQFASRAAPMVVARERDCCRRQAHGDFNGAPFAACARRRRHEKRPHRLRQGDRRLERGSDASRRPTCAPMHRHQDARRKQAARTRQRRPPPCDFRRFCKFANAFRRLRRNSKSSQQSRQRCSAQRVNRRGGQSR